MPDRDYENDRGRELRAAVEQALVDLVSATPENEAKKKLQLEAALLAFNQYVNPDPRG
jgi:hypothetical protein